MTKEALLKQLGYSINQATLNQIEDIINNTKGFEKFSKHLISLNESLKHLKGYISMSNSKPYLKIKMDDASNSALLDEFKEIIEHFSSKYNVELKEEKVNVYYIIGTK